MSTAPGPGLPPAAGLRCRRLRAARRAEGAASPASQRPALALPEVPKTEKSFEERLIFKAFLLKFVNSYTPIFYVAFFKGR